MGCQLQTVPTGLIPLIAGVPVLSTPPSQTLLLPLLLKQLHEPESESVKIYNPTAESTELLFTRITIQSAPWSRRIVAVHKPTTFSAVAILTYNTKQHATLSFCSLEIFSNKPVQVVNLSTDLADSEQG